MTSVSERGPLTEKEVLEIGKIIMNWNSIELMFEVIVSRVLGVKLETATTILKMASPGLQSDVVQAIILDRAARNDQTAEIQACAETFKSLAHFRNEIAHGRWWETKWTDDQAGEARLIKKGEAKERTVADFYTKSDQVRDLHRRLDAVIRKLYAA